MSHDDWRAETHARLSKSKIYQAFQAKCQKTSPGAGAHALSLVDDATFYAFQKTKTILKHMGEFTLHDGDHLFRVLLLMEKLLTPQRIEQLSIPESMLLMLGAFFHDIGMAPEEREVLSWRKVWDDSPVFVDDADKAEYERFLRHYSARPDESARIAALLAQGKNSEAELLKGYLISDYIRVTHADRARQIIEKDWMGKIKFRDSDLTVDFAAICFSHNEDAVGVLELEKKFDCGAETYACLPLVAVILRLADLLDFDAKRTPSVLFSHLFVRHPVSLQEWNKHRAVDAWSISDSKIQFSAKCAHPAVQVSINDFCDAIDKELSACNNVVAQINEFHKADDRPLTLKIPLKVDRSKIITAKRINGQPEFRYSKTEFTLSKRQVIDLLMGTKLYGKAEVALRELLQNSIDACLMRSAMEQSWGNLYKPEITVRYSTEDGDSILEVIDNGIGMDQYIIDTYYSKIGSSFYKSPDFYDLRSQAKSDFVPTSRFGIGILSCFMVADTVIVDTRKVYAPHSSSEPLNITIEGQESIFWIRSGARDRPGTSTKLFLRKQKNPWEKMTEEQFIEAVESVVPNPPFAISIETPSHKKERNENSFREITADSLKDYRWDKNDNVREFNMQFLDSSVGFVGSAVVAILEKHGKPVSSIEMTSKNVEIEGDSYSLEKLIKLGGKEIELSTTSITIDEDGKIDQSASSTRVFGSDSRLSLHGIEIPASLFPDSWSMQRNQVSLKWAVPILLVVDVCGRMDLDLNSSRTQIIMGDKWIAFEKALCVAIFQQVANQAGPDYWTALKAILIEKSKNEMFVECIGQIV